MVHGYINHFMDLNFIHMVFNIIIQEIQIMLIHLVRLMHINYTQIVLILQQYIIQV